VARDGELEKPCIASLFTLKVIKEEQTQDKGKRARESY
jgi:hypothetical protein